MNIELFKEKLEEKFPEENYAILYAGKNSQEISKFKCLDCGRIIFVNTGELFRKRRKAICQQCNKSERKDTAKNKEKIMKDLEGVAYDISFFKKKLSKKGNCGTAVIFTCKKCEHINEIIVANIIKNKTKCCCQYCEGNKINKDHIIYKKELEEKYPKKFTLLSDYINIKTRIKVRCNDCGFIYKANPNNLIRNGVCPKCKKSLSIGENKIEKILYENDIQFEKQKYFKEWNIGIHYFDFYIPKYNLVIEFNGSQHYSFNVFFHKTKENFEYRKEKDFLKKEKAIENNLNYLSIKYTLVDSIEYILEKVFNSTTNSKGKCFEIETIPKLDKDIV